MGAIIQSISYHLPDRIYLNDDFFESFPESRADRNNLLKLGIGKRHLVSPGETASDLAVKAALKLFEEHSIDKNTIDFLLFCAQEFDHYTPSTACIIQHRLGLKADCGALDYNLGCSGFVYGLGVAKGLVESLNCKNVLLLTSSTLTKTFHPRDKSSHFIFGDGAAATLISSSESSKVGHFIFGTDGSRSGKIIVKDGGARNKLSESSFKDFTDEYGNTTNDSCFFMNGPSIFNFGLKTVPKLVQDTLDKNEFSLDEIDLFIFHQANLFLIETISKKIGIPNEKIFNFMESIGNTVSSTIPIALAEALKAGKVKAGNKVLLCGFGTGLSWGSTIIEI
jgi:3-oxoacyl-[acyl-carrier-protein] synthase-3